MPTSRKLRKDGKVVYIPKSGGKAGSGAGKTDREKEFVYTPTRTDEISKKVSASSEIKTSRATITLKDERGKTSGMIRGLKRGDEGTPRMINRLWDIRKQGVDIDAIGRENIYFDGNQIYVVLDKRTEDFIVDQYKRGQKHAGKSGYVPFEEVFASDIKHIKERNAAYKRAEEIGAIILKTK